MIIFVLLMILSFVFAKCDDGQIDINGASLSELDDIKWVGPSTAQKIIDARPFDNVNDLIRVSGIAEGKLENIKSQGLACVEGETKEESEIEKDKETTFEEISKEVNEKVLIEDKPKEKSEINTIKLNTKNIKSEENNESLSKNVYAKYGLVVFCALLGFLFILKKRKYKTEFDENE